MSSEAISMTVAHDLEHGLDPFARAPAPEEDWQALHRLVRGAVPLTSIPREALDNVSAVAAAVTMRFDLHDAPEAPELAPPAWQLAALQALRGEQASTH
jgi:hypothetical protein